MSHRWLARRKLTLLLFALIIWPLRRTGALPAGELRAQQKGPGSIGRLLAYAAAAMAGKTQFKHTFQLLATARITRWQSAGPWRRLLVC